jgi:hypothetical protein
MFLKRNGGGKPAATFGQLIVGVPAGVNAGRRAE